MSDATGPRGIARDLARLVPEISDPDRLLPVLAVTPVPNAESVRPLLKALDRVRRRVKWIGTLCASEWPSADIVDPFLKEVQVYWDRFHNPAKPKLTGIKGDYPAYSALLDAKVAPPLAVEQLRAILVFCASRWVANNEHQTVIDVIASAVRGMARGLSDIGIAALEKLQNPSDLSQLAEAAEGINLDWHEGLKSVWWKYIVPELGRTSQSPQLPPPPPPPPGPPGGTRRRRKPKKLRKPRTRRVRSSNNQPTIHERTEAPDDYAGSEVVGDIPSRQRHKTGMKRDLFKAKQTIWSANSLLLSENIESLGIREASILGKALILEGGKSLATGQFEIARSLSCLALSFATGRSAKTLARLGKGAIPRDADDFVWSLDLDRGLICQTVLRPDSAYAPNLSEGEWVEPTTAQMSLVIAPELIAFLRRTDSTGVSLWGAKPEVIEVQLREACHHMAEVTGLKVTAGRVRRSLACLLQEEGRDLAATMLITGDTQGLSVAPLYYYAPQEFDLQQLYGKVTANIFGGAEPKLSIPSGKRIGCQLLVQRRMRHQFSRSLGAALQGQKTKKSSLESAITTHNAVASHTIGMFLGTAGHRPVDELFRLTRTSLDLDGFGALFQDKRVDLAHETRFAVLPTVLRDQLNTYLAHLHGLLPLLAKPAQRHLRSVLSGNEPLLFFLGPDGDPTELSIGNWLAQAPAAWQLLPPNHGRTTIATRGREAGGHPEALAIQLGHLEAVGFPFSIDGATAPILLAEELAPALDRVARDGGWKVRSGYASPQSEDIWKTFGPLPDWRQAITRHEARQKEALREAARAQRAEIRSHRLRAEEWVREALAKERPVIVHVLEKGKLPADGSQLEHLGPDEVVALQEGLHSRAGEDLTADLAAMNALRRLLLRLKKTFHWTGYVPFAWRSFRRAETTPFFPGLMLARIQIEALRAQFESIPKNPPAPITSWEWQCARTALALCLFGFVDDREQVIGVLRNATYARRCARLPDLLLVPWRDEPREVSGFRGLAAIAVAALARSVDRKPSEVSPERVETALHSMLPAEVCAPRANALQRLCAMTSAANRIELSGAARTALMDVASAAIERQQAWIDGNPVAETALSLVEMSPKRVPPSTPSVKRMRGDSRRQYWALLKLFPSSTHNTVLPRTKFVVKATQAETERNRVVAELRALAQEEGSNAVVAALACWAVKMLTEGTLQESNPAYGTVKSYLTTVGADLVSLTESFALTDFDEAELAQIYVDVVEMKGINRQSLAAREILHFHNSVAMQFDLPEIDSSELEIYRPKVEANVDAELILPQEWRYAVQRVARLCEEGGDDLARTPAQRRLLRQAKLLLQMIGATGARSGEPLGMRLAELGISDVFILAAFVRNRSRRIKTRAGQRVVDLSHRLAESDRQDLRNWIDAERSRLSDLEQRKGHVFSTSMSALDVSPKPHVKRLASLALGTATGRAGERLHRGRHMVTGLDGLPWFALAPPDRERLGLQSLSPSAGSGDGVQFPRDLRRQTAVIGHFRPLTSIKCYLHLTWLLRSRSDIWIQRRANRRTAAVAMGVSVFRADQLRQQMKDKDITLPWLDNGIAPREIVTVPVADQRAGPPIDLRRISVVEVGRLLGWTEDGVKPTTAALALGVTPQQLGLLHQAVGEYTSQIGRDFRSRGKDQGGVTRRMSSASHLYKLWEIGENGGIDEARYLTEVARALYALSRPSDNDSLVLPAREAGLLERLLGVCGHDLRLIETRNHSTKAALRVLRVKRSGTDNSYAGLELKRIIGVVWIHNRLLELV